MRQKLMDQVTVSDAPYCQSHEYGRERPLSVAKHFFTWPAMMIASGAGP
jgi:hypothetical protein